MSSAVKSLWKILERDGIENFPYWLEDEDRCAYTREYHAGKGYGGSYANQQIINLKKDPSKKGTRQWKYKQQAVNLFAGELQNLLKAQPYIIPIIFIPPSSPRDDPEYDPRFDMVGRALKRRIPEIQILNPIERVFKVDPLHKSGSRRNPEKLQESLEWTGDFPEDTNAILVVDDVITSGASFKSIQNMIHTHAGHHVNVYGAFWTKCVY